MANMVDSKEFKTLLAIVVGVLAWNAYKQSDEGKADEKPALNPWAIAGLVGLVLYMRG